MWIIRQSEVTGILSRNTAGASADIIGRMHDYKTESSTIVSNLKFWLVNLGEEE